MPKNIVSKFTRREFVLGSAATIGAVAVGSGTAEAKPPVEIAYWSPIKAAPVPFDRPKPIPHVVKFPETVVQPGELVTIQAQPQCLFRGKHIIARAPDGYSDLCVVAFFVGKKGQSLDGKSWSSIRDNPLPLSKLASLDVEVDTCDKALSMTLQIKNTGTIPRRVKLEIGGVAVL